MTDILRIIKKDNLFLMTSAKMTVIVFVLFCFIMPMKNLTVALVIPVFASYFLIFGIFAYEEKSKTDLVNAMLPVRREDWCIARYISSIVYILVGTVLAFLGGCIGNLVSREADVFQSANVLNLVPAIIAIGLIYTSVILPIVIKFGALKTRYIMFILYFVSFACVEVLKEMAVAGLGINVINKSSSMVILLGSIGIYFLSYCIARNMYINKDFN